MKALYTVLVLLLVLSSCSSDANKEVVIKVDYSPVFTKMARGNNSQFEEVLDATKSKVAQKHFVDIFFENARKMYPEMKFRNYFEWNNGISAGMSDKDVKVILRQRCDAAMDKMINGMKLNFPKNISFKGAEHLNHSKIKLLLKTDLSDQQLRKYMQSEVDLRFYRTLNLYNHAALIDHIQHSLNPTVTEDEIAVDSDEELTQINLKATNSFNIWHELKIVSNGKYAECSVGYVQELLDSLNRFEKEHNYGLLQYFSEIETIAGESKAIIYGCPSKPKPKVALTGKQIRNATSGMGQNGEFVVEIELNPKGTEMFAQLSTEEIGNPVLIVINGEVVSAPFVNEPIRGGKVQISGGFNEKEAGSLAAILNKGKWALPCEVLSVKKRYW